MKPTVFLFQFDHYDPDRDPEDYSEEVVLTLESGPEVPPETGYGASVELIERVYDDFIKPHDLQSRYGIHDWSSGEDPDRQILFGYNTYEVEPKNVDDLIDEWEEILDELGYTISDRTRQEL